MIFSFISLLYITKGKVRNNLAMTVAIWFLILFGATEIMSAFHAITMETARWFWGCLDIVGIIACVVKTLKEKPTIKTMYTIDDIINTIIVCWFILLGYMAWKIVPFNYDSMTYHLARISNWIQNKSVSYYSTNIPRQLFSPILSEYAILHTYLLLGKDVVANLVQAISYAFCGYFLYHITTKLGFIKPVKYMVVILFAMMPMAIAQSVTTQVDLVGCLWLLAFIDIVIDLIYVEKLDLKWNNNIAVLGCATTVAFGYLSKSTVCIAMLFFLILLFGVRVSKKDKIIILFCDAIMAGVWILLLVMPSFIRNYKYTGDFLATGYVGRIAVGTWNPKLLVLNMYKNWALLSTTIKSQNFLANTGLKLAAVFKCDINDEAISFTKDFVGGLPISLDCDTSNCNVASWFFAICILIGLVCLLYRKTKGKIFALACMLSVFAGLMIVRYQYWGSRLLLPFAVLMSLFCGWTVQSVCSIWGKYRNIFGVIAASVVCTIAIGRGVPSVVYQANYLTEYVQSNDRIKMYFAGNQGVYKQYVDICAYVNDLNCNKIGIYLGSDTYEYPLWVLLKNDETEIIQVVDGTTEGKIPECIIAINRGWFSIGDEYEYMGNTYVATYNYGEDNSYAVLVSSTANVD